MPKPENLPTPENKPTPKPKRTGKEAASLAASRWAEHSNRGKGVSDYKISIPVPAAGGSVEFTNLVAEGNVVKVWTNGNVDPSDPDYIIVNPPVEVQVSKTETVEDPLAAIAQAIHGVTK
jgi:hypothetical protein